MLESFTIEKYRSFNSFKLSKLGRVNLLVGENNSGKTSILEAIYLYSSYPDLTALLEILNFRGEFSWVEDDNFFTNSIDSPIKRMRRDFNIANIFHGYNFNENSSLYLSTLVNRNKDKLHVFIEDNYDTIEENIEQNIVKQKSIYKKSKSYNLDEFALNISLTKEKQKYSIIRIPISNEGDLLLDSIQKTLRRSRLSDKTNKQNSQLITLFHQDIDDLIEVFDDISLTPKEDIVIEAVRIIEPKIKRIATTKSERGEKGSFKISLDGYEKPISIGTMGDGIWRLLTIALAMVNTQDGVLLIDEIDTGLHFTTLLKMWELILETSKKLNVQVFATTHNSDCWMALAKLIEEKNSFNNNHSNQNEVTLHRIEADKNESILFDAEDIVIASNNDIEVR